MKVVRSFSLRPVPAKIQSQNGARREHPRPAPRGLLFCFVPSPDETAAAPLGLFVFALLLPISPTCQELGRAPGMLRTQFEPPKPASGRLDEGQRDPDSRYSRSLCGVESSVSFGLARSSSVPSFQGGGGFTPSHCEHSASAAEEEKQTAEGGKGVSRSKPE